MPSLALSAPVWVVIAGVLLFGIAAVLRLTFALVREVKGLGRTVGEAAERVRVAAENVNRESRSASERAERLRRGR